MEILDTQRMVWCVHRDVTIISSWKDYHIQTRENSYPDYHVWCVQRVHIRSWNMLELFYYFGLENLPMNFPSHRENEALERVPVFAQVQGDYSVVQIGRDSPLTGDCPIDSK